MEKSRGELGSGQRRLRDAERATGEIATRLRQLKLRERENARTLAHVQAERDALARRIAAQKETLARDARHAWLLGRQQQLRLWLSADDPQRAARVARYYEYLQRDRAARLEAFNVDLAALAQSEARVSAEQQQLAGARAELAARETELAAAREERRLAVAALASELRASESELRQRQNDEAALRRLFGNVREAFRDIPPEAVGSPLAKRKGKLRWPVPGRLAATYGSPVAEGKLTLNGIIIAASEGDTVRAVHAGRVVFADWLRGYGLLLILDHGDGYLTVYGHNQAVARAVGDWVQEGDTVASVGASGGRSAPGLYFEIRHNGDPQDPARWLRR